MDYYTGETQLESCKSFISVIKQLKQLTHYMESEIFQAFIILTLKLKY